MSSSVLNYRAGPEALAILQQRGLSPSDVRTLLLPAIGPKWLVLVGLDRALLERGWLDDGSARRLLFGASVGAWRALALGACDPHQTHAALVDAYCGQRFTHADTPSMISAAYRRLIHDVFSDADIAHALAHPRLDLAIAVARARGLFGSELRAAQALSILTAACTNAVHAGSQRWFFERVIFDSSARAPESHPALRELSGMRAPLCLANVRAVALASGTVPLYMQSVRDLMHAPAGTYLDGGFSDYHINQRLDGGAGINLLLLHQPRIVPSWLDKFVPWRGPSPGSLARLLLVHPSRDFVRSLPGSAVPTRDDFMRYVADPERRIERWQSVVSRSVELGERFMEDVASGAIVSRIQPL